MWFNVALECLLKSLVTENLIFRERMSRLLLPFADQQIEIPSLMPGNIALTVGLKQVMQNTDTVKELVALVCFLLLGYSISDVFLILVTYVNLLYLKYI